MSYRFGLYIIIVTSCLIFCTSSYALDESYWIWAGKTTKGLPSESTLYIHQGTLERKRDGKPPILRRQGLGSINLESHPIYIVYRIEDISYPNQIIELFNYDSMVWKKKGSKIIGLQIDFDSPSKKLDKYIDFLSKIRLNLSDPYRLSITGLADWASSSPRSSLQVLAKTVDEIVFQLYQEKNEIPFLELYVQSLISSGIPFKIGIIENQRYILKKFTFDSKFYRGSVIFK